ncbi:MAG: hypothetical protein HQL14_05125 [Candidatus Omnitrophica bacterium]|nr:hypothetical protein [Candidatus Omnitrophota bacterium]
MMTNTDALLKGLNPYAMAQQPQCTNVYGIIFPLLTWPLVKLLGHTLIIHRLVTGFSILASCALVSFVLKKMKIPFLLNIWASLMLYSSLLYPGTSTPCIDPAATGLFFLLATIFVPWFCKYSYKSLFISALCGIFALYSKQYTVLGVIVMATYLFLFVSKIKGFFYGFLWLLLLFISALAANLTLPAYFNNCFFSILTMNPAWSSMERLHVQIVMYRALHKWTLILMGIFTLAYGFKMISEYFGADIKSRIKKIIFCLNIINIKEPLIRLSVPLGLYAGLWSASVLYLSLGRHGGAMLWYFFQLLSPFLLIGAVWLFSRYAFWPIICVPFLILNLYTITADQDGKYFNKNTQGWPEISLLVSQHRHILNSPIIAPMLIEQNKEVFDNGETEYFLEGSQLSPLIKIFFKEDPRVFLQLLLFFENIKDMIQNKKFDLILLQPSLLPMGVGEQIKKYYKFEGEFMVYAPQDRRPYAITVWIPL